jgi:hypothetical protein
MLRRTFPLELRQVLTRTDHIARGELFDHFTAIKRGCVLAAQIGFTEGNKEMQITQFGGIKRNRVQRARYTGIQTAQAQIRETQNG